MRVVASFYPVYEAARRVGGDRVEVSNLTPAGVEPHDLELSSKTVDRIIDAGVVLYLGHGFQPAVERAVRRSKGKAVDLLAPMPLHKGEQDVDPHVWLDPVLMTRIVDEVRSALSDADPSGAPAFADNATAYAKELSALDQEYRTGLTACARTLIITSHEAFGYLAQRYGLEQRAAAGLSPEAEPEPGRLAELADLVRRTGSTTVFSETLVSPKVAETLAREAGVKTAVLDPIEGLTEEEQRAGKTYLAVMRDNLAALRAALACPGI